MMKEEKQFSESQGTPNLCDSTMPPPDQPQSNAHADPEKQAEYRREYLVQLRQRVCPGCGEGVAFY